MKKLLIFLLLLSVNVYSDNISYVVKDLTGLSYLRCCNDVECKQFFSNDTEQIGDNNYTRCSVISHTKQFNFAEWILANLYIIIVVMIILGILIYYIKVIRKK